MMEKKDAILLIENDAILRDIMTLALNRPRSGKKNYEIIAASDGLEAFKLLQRFQPQLVLLDMLLPKWNALDFLKEAKRQQLLTDQPVIILSSLAYREVVEQALQLGASDFLLKPLNVDELINRVDLALIRGKDYRPALPKL
jgi:DNA-binding response OmpR family regulator